MTSVRLIAVSDEYDRDLGLAFFGKGCTDYQGFMADQSGTLIAHDIVEHQNGKRHIGTVWDELEALGGVWFCRGVWGDFEGHHDAYVNIAADVTRMFSDWTSERAPAIPRTRPNIDIDDDMAEILAHARKDIPIAWEHEDYDAADIDRYLDEALNHMRAGYLKAKRRHGSTHTANYLYHSIAAAVNPCAKNADFEGQQFILTYTRDGATCRECLEIEYQ